MAQKEKENMRQEIMDSAVRIVARYGLDKTTTNLIAKEASLNEMYLYRCFKNKEDVLSEAFHAEDVNFVKFIEKALSVLRLDGLSLEERCFLLWKSCWEFILKKPDDCRFYIRYYYSANCKTYAYERHLQVYKPLIDKIRYAFKPDANVDILVHQIFDTMLSFAERVQTGEFPNNEETTRMTFRQVFIFVVINVRPELLEGNPREKAK